MWEIDATSAATRFIKDDPDGLRQVLHAVDLLAQEPRPAGEPNWADRRLTSGAKRPELVLDNSGFGHRRGALDRGIAQRPLLVCAAATEGPSSRHLHRFRQRGRLITLLHGMPQKRKRQISRILTLFEGVTVGSGRRRDRGHHGAGTETR
jgi:hypothetical protein